MKLRGYLFAAATAATAVAGLTVPAQAATFGNTGITFDKDTTVNFTFQESHGLFRSDLKVQETGGGSTVLFSEASPGYDGRANDWHGTCGITVANCNTSFKFEANKTYTLVLTRRAGSNGTAARAVYSTDSLNEKGYRQAIFTGDVFSGTTVSFEDIGGGASPGRCAAQGSNPNGDCDFNDFIVTAQAESETSESVPEPATLAGLGAVAVGFVASRRRRKTA
jgi:hypothetical protein